MLPHLPVSSRKCLQDPGLGQAEVWSWELSCGLSLDWQVITTASWCLHLAGNWHPGSEGNSDMEHMSTYTQVCPPHLPFFLVNA